MRCRREHDLGTGLAGDDAARCVVPRSVVQFPVRVEVACRDLTKVKGRRSAATDVAARDRGPKP